jgi:hypothetical protein
VKKSTELIFVKHLHGKMIMLRKLTVLLLTFFLAFCTLVFPVNADSLGTSHLEENIPPHNCITKISNSFNVIKVQEWNDSDSSSHSVKIREDTAPLTERFKLGVTTPLELLFFEPQKNNNSGNYYLTQLTMETRNKGTVTVIDLDPFERVLRYHLDVEKVGLELMTEPGLPVNRPLDDFIANNYIEWCSKWNKGINNYWKICGGSDCAGDGNRWCIKRVDREQCELQGNCPTNNN